MKVIALWIIGGVLAYTVLGVIGSAFKLFTLPLFKFEQKVQTNQDLIKKTYDPDNVLYNYHWFQERYQAIQSNKQRIDDSQAALDDFERSAGPRDQWSFEDKTEDARLRSIVQGLKSQQQEWVAEYNARASEVDRSIFQNGLPLFVGLD